MSALTVRCLAPLLAAALIACACACACDACHDTGLVETGEVFGNEGAAEAGAKRIADDERMQWVTKRQELRSKLAAAEPAFFTWLEWKCERRSSFAPLREGRLFIFPEEERTAQAKQERCWEWYSRPDGKYGVRRVNEECVTGCCTCDAGRQMGITFYRVAVKSMDAAQTARTAALNKFSGLRSRVANNLALIRVKRTEERQRTSTQDDRALIEKAREKKAEAQQELERDGDVAFERLQEWIASEQQLLEASQRADAAKREMLRVGVPVTAVPPAAAAAAVPAAKTGTKYTVVLNDGTEINASFMMKLEGEFSLRDQSGKMRTIKSGDVNKVIENDPENK
jgi:hypothetical protein